MDNICHNKFNYIFKVNHFLKDLLKIHAFCYLFSLSSNSLLKIRISFLISINALYGIFLSWSLYCLACISEVSKSSSIFLTTYAIDHYKPSFRLQHGFLTTHILYALLQYFEPFSNGSLRSFLIYFLFLFEAGAHSFLKV